MPTIMAIGSDGAGSGGSGSRDKRKAHPAKVKAKMRRDTARKCLFAGEGIWGRDLHSMRTAFHCSEECAKPFVFEPALE